MRKPDEYTVSCPTCGAGPRAACRTPRGKTLAGAHVARMSAQHPACRNCGVQETTHPIETCATFQHPDATPVESHARRSLAFEVPDGYTLGYHLTREAWFWRNVGDGVDLNLLTVGLFHRAGGEQWSFAVDESAIGSNTLRVGVFDDAWAAFAAIPEVFVALGETLGRGALLDEVTDLLDEFGFVDMTRRDRTFGSTSAQSRT